MAKEGYTPTSGMKAAAKRAIRWKEEGKAKGAGTMVGWTRAGQLARGETLSLSTVKRMYSFFSRHEVDKKGKDFYNTSNPSNGRIMWDAWGGDAGFSWSRKIVEREKNVKKSYTQNELFEEIKDILDDAVNPVDTVIEIPDDEDITKTLRAEVTREQMYALVQHLQEAIEAMIETPEEEMDSETETEPAIEIQSANPAPVGDPDKNEINWPVAKSNEDYQSDNEEEDKWDNIQKACWSGYRQDGMKEKNGRMVPNCVPIKKSTDSENNDIDKAKDKYKDVIDDRKGEPADKELYARIIAEAKRKFDVYPSAYANGWVVQEYKRRGGKYKVSKSEENNMEDSVQKSIWGGRISPIEFAKRKFSTEQRARMAESGTAMPDGSYPIANRRDLMNAIRSWGRGGSDPKVKEHIKRRARALGASDMIPENWK